MNKTFVQKSQLINLIFCLIFLLGQGTWAEETIVRIGDMKTIRVILIDWNDMPINDVKAFLNIVPASRGQITPSDGVITDSSGVAVFTFNALEAGVTTFTATAETIDGFPVIGKVEKIVDILPPAVNLTIERHGNGIISPDIGSHTYSQGDEITITAVPDPGWEFICWEGAVADPNANITTVTLDASKTVTAKFEQLTYSLTFNEVGNGYVTADSNGPYYYNDVVTLTAVPDPGWEFVGWSSNVDAQNRVIITRDTTVIATFKLTEYNLTVESQGNGTISKTPDGPYYYNDVVTLTAVPDLGWEFVGWSSNVDAQNRVTITGDTTVIATFKLIEYNLTVEKDGSGTVIKSPGGPYHYNDVVTLATVPDPGWEFVGWSSNVDAQNRVTITGDTTVIATFKLIEYNLTVEKDGSGTVIKSPGGPYYYNDVVTLTAVPDPGWKFVSWSSNVDGQNCVTITDNTTVIAIFERIEYSLIVEIQGNGTVTKTSDGPYYYGDIVTLRTVPEDGWTFAKWEGHLSGTSKQIRLEVNGNKTVTAIFAYLIKSGVKNEIIVPSDNGDLYITVPFNAVTENSSLIVEPTSLDPEQQATAEGLNPIGLAYQMSDLQFQQPVLLTFAYKDEDNDGIVDGTDILETTLRVFRWSGSKWIDVGSTIDPVANTITAIVTYSSTYAVMGDPMIQGRALLSDVAFLANPFQPEVDGETALQVFLRQPAKVRLVIWNKRGNKIIYQTEKFLSGFNQNLTWNGKDMVGRQAPAGLYIYQVIATTEAEKEQTTGLLSIKR